jgi:hypothetical protein
MGAAPQLTAYEKINDKKGSHKKKKRQTIPRKSGSNKMTPENETNEKSQNSPENSSKHTYRDQSRRYLVQRASSCSWGRFGAV